MILRFSGKVGDQKGFTIIDDRGVVTDTVDDASLSSFQIGSGDYVRFELDLATGKIVGFKPMSDDDVEEAIAEE